MKVNIQKTKDRIISIFGAVIAVVCVGLSSITVNAEEITNLDLTLNVKLYNTAYTAVSINQTVQPENNERFLYEWEASNIGVNYGTTASFTATVGTDDGSIIAKKNDTFNFRIDNICMDFYMKDYGWFSWSNGSDTDRQLALIHTDGTWTYLYEGIDWSYSSDNQTHNISVNVTTQKDVRKIQYVESIGLLDLADLKMNGLYDNITVLGDAINPLKVTIDKQSEESGLLEDIGDQIGSAINGTPEQNDKVNSAVDEMNQASDKLGALGDSMSSVEKPSADNIKTDISNFVDPVSWIVLTAPFHKLWENDTLLAMLSVVVTLVIVSWVFFGKKK